MAQIFIVRIYTFSATSHYFSLSLILRAFVILGFSAMVAISTVEITLKKVGQKVIVFFPRIQLCEVGCERFHTK